jgi:alanine racemase
MKVRRRVTEASLRHVWAEIDLNAVRHNAGVMKRLAGRADLCAVVKADAYGHGAVAVARAAIEGGATWLGVAVVEEGVELREAGITAPVLVLSEPPPEAMAEAVSNGLVPTVYTKAGIAAAEQAATSVGEAGGKVDVHLKVDTGMHRVGADPDETVALARAVGNAPHLRLGSVWTHLAVAEGLGEEDRSFTNEQIRRYEEVLSRLDNAGIAVPLRHAANTAGTIFHPSSRYDMVRSGIAIYGELPAPELAPLLQAAGDTLLPVMSLRARVMLVRALGAGERPSYGRRRALPDDSVVAVIPLGYADGVPRAWFDRNGTVLVGGQHRPLAGTVTMDQIVIDCGTNSGVEVGDEVVLIGRQGASVLSASDWATVLGTISYEVLCGIGPRVTRVVVGELGGDPEESMTEGAETPDRSPRTSTSASPTESTVSVSRG